MFDRDKWQEIYHSIRKNKLRALLTAFGVSWGIFMLVILMGAGAGLENGAVSGFDIAKNAVFVWTQRTSMPYKGLQPGRFLQLKNSDVAAIRQSVPEVSSISPILRLRGEFSIEHANESASFTVNGGNPSFLDIKPLLISEGRFINANDLSDRRKVAVIGSRVQEVLFPDGEHPIGNYINIKGVPFLVVGIFESQARGEDAIEDVQTVHIPLTALQQAFNRPEEIDWLGLLPQQGVSADLVEQKVKTLLAQRHLVAPEDNRAFGSANVEKEYKELQTVFGGIRGFSWLVAIGTIIAGVVGVGNIMMIVVKERTKEFGIRKALGATPWSIISMILMEALVLTGIAGYAGLALGVAVVEGIRFGMLQLGLDSPFFYNPEIDLGTAIAAILVLVIAGLVAGLIPGLRAANVNPVIALREE